MPLLPSDARLSILQTVELVTVGLCVSHYDYGLTGRSNRPKFGRITEKKNLESCLNLGQIHPQGKKARKSKYFTYKGLSPTGHEWA